jgi:hypothetical protein
VPSPASVAKVATISKSLRQETASPKIVNPSSSPPAVQVEMAWKRLTDSNSSGASTSTLVSPLSAVCNRSAAGVRAAHTSHDIAYSNPTATPVRTLNVPDSVSARSRYAPARPSRVRPRTGSRLPADGIDGAGSAIAAATGGGGGPAGWNCSASPN